VPQNTYDEILYESSARFATHPDRLAAIARLFGMDPAPLGDAYPRSLTFAGLIPYGGSEAALRGILTGMVLSGFADFHVYCFPCHQGVSAKPAASRRHATRRSTRTPWLTLASASWRWTRSAATWCPYWTDRAPIARLRKSWHACRALRPWRNRGATACLSGTPRPRDSAGKLVGPLKYVKG
jgi:hypothetical protein